MVLLADAFNQQVGQGWGQFADLALAFGLSSLIGLDRETRQRSAGLRTYTLVGFVAALIMLVSKYGFGDVVDARTVVLDPSRIAAQIVTGIGFIGGGLILVRRDAVRGLTTAAGMWLTAAIGMACGAGLPLLAVAGTSGTSSPCSPTPHSSTDSPVRASRSPNYGSIHRPTRSAPPGTRGLHQPRLHRQRPHSHPRRRQHRITRPRPTPATAQKPPHTPPPPSTPP